MSLYNQLQLYSLFPTIQCCVIVCFTTPDHTNVSGASDYDYPTLATQVPALANLPYVGGFKHTPLPPELLEHFDRILTGCSPVQLPHWVFPCTVTSLGVPLYSYVTGCPPVQLPHWVFPCTIISLGGVHTVSCLDCIFH